MTRFTPLLIDIAASALALVAGGEIDYEGATGVSLSADGDAAGSYRVIEIDYGAFHNDQRS